MNQEIVSNRKKHCSICHYPISEGTICRLCESKKQWLEDKEYFCTSRECGRFLPGATKPGLCDVCRQVAAEPVAPPKQTLKSEKQPKPQENQSMEKPESCAKCGNRLTKNGFCRRCAVKNGMALRKKSPAESPESVAPETGAKEPVCNETDPKVTQEKSNVTFEAAANASEAPRGGRVPEIFNRQPEIYQQNNPESKIDEASTIADLPVSLRELQRLAYENAIAKGWHETPRSDGEMICLMHSELSEALEELRNGRHPAEIYRNGEKPEGVPIELADVVIRIFDFCGLHRINLQSAIVTKMVYNQTRLHRHGGKKL